MKNSKNTDSRLMSQTAPLNFMLYIVMMCASAWLTVTTSLSLYAMVAQSLATTNSFVFWSAMAFIFSLGITIVDLGNGHLIQSYFFKKETMTEEQKNNKYYNSYLTFMVRLVCMRLAISVLLTLYVTPDAAVITTEESRQDEYLAQVDTVKKQKIKEITFLRDDKISLEKSEAKRISSAKKRGNQLINEAINSGTIWQIKSYKNEKFDWIASSHPNNTTSNKRYARRIRNAHAKKEQLIQAEKDRTISTAQLYHDAQGADSLFSVQVSTLLQSANDEKATFANTVNRRTNIFYLVDFVCILLIPFCGYMIVQRLLAANFHPSDKSFVYVASMAASKRYDSWISRLETKWQIDIDGNGVIGTTGVRNFSTDTKTPVASFPIEKEQPKTTTGTPKKNTQKEQAEHPTQNTPTEHPKPSANKGSSVFSEQIGEVIIIEDKRVFPHRTEQGGTTYMSETQCKSRLKKAEKRLIETEEKINAGTATQQTINARTNRQKNVQYWRAAVSKFA